MKRNIKTDSYEDIDIVCCRNRDRDKRIEKIRRKNKNGIYGRERKYDKNVHVLYLKITTGQICCTMF